MQQNILIYIHHVYTALLLSIRVDNSKLPLLDFPTRNWKERDIHLFLASMLPH